MATVGTGVYSYGVSFIYLNSDVISAAVGLDGVFGYAEIIGNSGVAPTIATQEFNPLFLCSSHMFSSISEGNKRCPSTVYRQERGICVL